MSDLQPEVEMDLNTPLRLFTQSPNPDQDCIVLMSPKPYCANTSLFSYTKGENFHFKFVEVSADAVLEYIYAQAAILKYNNPNTYEPIPALMSLYKIFNWGSEDPLTFIATDTLHEIVHTIHAIDNVDDLIPFQNKSLWYADYIMKPIRYLDETWRDYSKRITALKAAARKKLRTITDKSILEDASLQFKVQNSTLPTPKHLSEDTNISARRIRQVTKEDVIWQNKRNYTISKVQSLKRLLPNITNAQLSELSGIPVGTLKKISQK